MMMTANGQSSDLVNVMQQTQVVSGMEAQREFEMTDADFAAISALAHEFTGIVLAEHKRNMVYSRIARRVRALRLTTFSEYLAYLKGNHDQEVTDFINALTTNLTSLFRESHHFDFLREDLFPKLQASNRATKRLRIWSAGCSIGQEAYSIAMTIKQCRFPADWDIKILATDLDSNVLETGAAGVYPHSHIEDVDEDILRKFFRHSADFKTVQIKDELRRLVFFKRLNLLEQWPMSGLFDIVFCRNVVIYFNKETQRVLFDRYAEILPVGGHLFIGHSENLAGISDRFEPLGNTIYRKVR